ncbi:hypothetical protein BF49_1740 [Bradyrhizobium sp.]|nr:hypothetical protein BF49_1740 [Bradyrhizobium sp.]
MQDHKHDGGQIGRKRSEQVSQIAQALSTGSADCDKTRPELIRSIWLHVAKMAGCTATGLICLKPGPK